MVGKFFEGLTAPVFSFSLIKRFKRNRIIESFKGKENRIL